MANQRAFHASTARTRLVFGGNQSGKSRCVAQEIKWWLEESHPYRETPLRPKIYVVSADYRTLGEGVFRHLLGDPGHKTPAILHEWDIVRYGTYIPGTTMPSWFLHRNGGVVNLISGEGGEKARQKVQAAAIDLCCVDEEVPGDMWQELMARRLTYGGEVTVSATLVRSEEWLIDLEERAETGDKEVFMVRLDTKRAVDRGHIDRLAYEEMEGTLSEQEIHVRLRGGSRKRQGLVYPEFGKDHIVEPYDIGVNWTRFCGIDPGRRTCAVIWGAVDPDGKIHIYREGYFRNATYHEVAKYIQHVEGWVAHPKTDELVIGEKTEILQNRWVDPHAYDHAVSGQPGVATLLAGDYRIYTSPAPNAVHYGIEKVHQYLRKGMDDTPGLVVFKTCVNLIREMRGYKWVDDTKGGALTHSRKDQPVKRNDHACDALRYMLAGGVKFHKDNPRAEKLRREMEKIRDIEAYASPQLQDRMRQWWVERELRKRGLNQGGGYIGGIGQDGR